MDKQPAQATAKVKTFGAQPTAPSGLRHISPWLKVLAGGGVLAAIAMYLAQIFIPEYYRPSMVAGRAAGDAVRAEIDQMKEAKIDMERRIADATAQANAKAQADLMVMQKTIEARTASLEPVGQMAALADIFCMGAHVVSGMTEPQGWNRQSSDDIYFAAQRAGKATCGASAGIRQAVTASQLEAINTTAAARGAPMTNGAVQQATAPAPSAAPAGAPHLQLTGDQKAALRDYAIGLPHDALVSFVEGLDMSVGRPDAWYDRVAMYRVTHPY